MIPCLKCGGNLFVLFGARLECEDCGNQFKYGKIKRLKRNLEKKCVTCGNYFKNTHTGVLNCSANCSVKYRKKYFRKYNKKHKEAINISRQKYEKNKRGKNKK